MSAEGVEEEGLGKGVGSGGSSMPYSCASRRRRHTRSSVLIGEVTMVVVVVVAAVGKQRHA